MRCGCIGAAGKVREGASAGLEATERNAVIEPQARLWARDLAGARVFTHCVDLAARVDVIHVVVILY
jgi:hypothetical protein